MPSTRSRVNLMHIFTSVCKNLGVPIATDKTEGPTTYITYLGLEINTVSQTFFIPHDKVTSLTEQLNEINNHKKVTLQQLQSLCELLAFCSRSLPPARAFTFEALVCLPHTDTIALVSIINSESSKSEHILSPNRPLVLKCLQLNLH